MKKVNVAIIGAGLIGNKRAEAIQRIPEYTLRSVFDLNLDAMNAFAEKYSCKTANSVEAILEDEHVDLVILAIAHKPAASLAPLIVSRKHLLIEKPLGRTRTEAEAIVKAAKKSKKQLYVGFNYRYYPHIRKAMEYASSGKLGDIISSTFTIGHAAQPGYETTWKMSKEVCGGGVIIDPGIHFIDLMTGLFGPPKNYSLYMDNKGWNAEVEDEAIITFTFDTAPSVHHYSLNYSKNTLYIELVGTKGVVRIYGRGGNYGDMQFTFVPRWHWKTGEKVIEENFGSEDTSFLEEMKDMLKTIKKDRTDEYVRYLASMAVVDSIYS